MHVRSLALAAATAVAVGVCAPFEAALRSQQPPASVPPAIAKLLADGLALLEDARPKEAKPLFDQALALALERGQPRDEANAQLGLGRALAQMNDVVAARRALTRALELFETLADDGGRGRVWNQLGTIAYYESRWDEARTAYERALAAFGRASLALDEANVLRNLTFLPTMSIDERLDLVARAVERARQAGAPVIEGLSLHNWGDLLHVKGDYAGAKLKLEAALALLERAGTGIQLARLYTSFGRLYRVHGEPALALPYYERALEQQRALRDVRGEIQTLNAIALASYILGRAAEARSRYEQALERAEAMGLAPESRFVQQQLGIFFIEQGDPQRGITLIERGLGGETASTNRIRALTAMSKGWAELGRHAEAASAADEAVRLASTGSDIEARRLAHYTRARSRRAAGRPADALEDTRESLRLVEQLRPNLVPADSLRLGFGERLRAQFDFSVSLLAELGHFEEALVATEQGRSRAFLDLLASADANRTAAAGSRPAADLVSTTAAGAPSLAALKQTAARLQSTVVGYWVMRDGTFVWLVEPNGTVQGRVIRVAQSRLDALVRATAMGPSGTRTIVRGAGATQDRLAIGATDDRAWRELYDLLILPMRQWFPRGVGQLLTIVPDGPLFRLSFAALKNERGRYLLEGYRLHYTSALAVLPFTARQKWTVAPQERLLLVANPTLPLALAQSERLSPLPGAAREARAIAAVQRGAAVRLLTGVDASETQVRAAAPDQSLLHFAGHSVIRDDRPMDSFLALAGEAVDPARDGRLTAFEIYGLHLNASLVVLSACRSAGGKVTGDGVVGLVRAFLYAGAPSVIASVWDLPDETAPWLFERFYRAGGGRQDSGAALRAAQLALLRALRAGTFSIETRAGTFTVPEHPSFWAGLQLWGEPSGVR